MEGEQVRWKWGLMDLPCNNSLFFCQHCKAQGTVAACRLQFCWWTSPVAVRSGSSCSSRSPSERCHICCRNAFPDCIPDLGSHHAGPGCKFNGTVLKSVFVSKTQTLPVASFSSASLGEQLQLTGTQLLLEEEKEYQSSSSHSKIKSSQEILLLENFRVASSWIPDSWKIRFLLFLCHWGRTGKNLSLCWGHSFNCHCFHVQYF